MLFLASASLVTWPYRLYSEVTLPGAFVQKSILIVDDNPQIRKIIRSVLEDADCAVCGEAVNGQDGIEKAARLHPDLVILDLAMPVMNGLEAARVLTKTMPGVILVLLTNHTNELVESEARAAGIKAVLSKEDGIKKLAELCSDLISSSEFTKDALGLRKP
jgi:DNA-binding NarL/FixJ family response regulator